MAKFATLLIRLFWRLLILAPLALLRGCSLESGLMSAGERLDLGDPLAMDPGYPQLMMLGNRQVAVLDRGDPNGFPIFYAHGCPGSRLEIIFLEREAQRQGFRLITFDRPGFGESDYVAPYGLLDFAADLEQIADRLHIPRFGLIGWSSGGPPVLATAYRMPERAQFAIISGSYTNFGELPNAIALMKEKGLRGPSLEKNAPKLFDGVLTALRWADLRLPELYLKEARDVMHPADRRVLDDPAVADLFIRAQQEGLRPGIEGAVQDLQVQYAPWPFSLRDVTTEVYVYQGQQDALVPWQFAEHMATTLPHATLHLLANQGHLIPLQLGPQRDWFELAREIVDASQPRG